jgi:hypothetical protein
MIIRAALLLFLEAIHPHPVAHKAAKPGGDSLPPQSVCPREGVGRDNHTKEKRS